MKYFVSIGTTKTNWLDERPKAEQELFADRLEPLPFGVDTLEDAHLIIRLSKSPVWTIRYAEEDEKTNWLDMWQQKGEIEASPMVLRTREVDQAEREKGHRDSLARVAAINAQPKVVTRTYAGIAVTFTREDTQLKDYRPFDARVSVTAGGKELYIESYITSNGRIQKAKWVEYYAANRWGEGRGPHLVPLAPHLLEIQAIAKALSIGRYQEEATPVVA